MRDGASTWKEETASTAEEAAAGVESQTPDELENAATGAIPEEEARAEGDQAARTERRVIGEVREELRQTARQTGGVVIELSDTGLQQAAAGLDEAIARVRMQAERMAQAGQYAASALRQASGRLQRLRGQAQLKDSARFMRQNPSVILTAGVIAGFIAGSVLQTGSLKESMAILTGRDSEQ